ncbi:AAA family ATPase [Robinsoniella peoriensis]
MIEKKMVRIIQSELLNFKNVKYGQIKYMNYSSVQNDACIKENDIVGIYGQNGSGKTAMVEALDILRHVLSGIEIPYDTYEGLLSDNKDTIIKTIFFVEKGDMKYRVGYNLTLGADKTDKKILLKTERLSFEEKGVGWKKEKKLQFSNPYYNGDAIINDMNPEMESKRIHFFEKTGMLKNLAVYCAQKNVSILFNELISKSISSNTAEINGEQDFENVIRCLMHFGRGCFQVVKVNQLGAINNNIIPLNVHREKGNMITQGCLPLVMMGRGEVPEEIFEQLKPVIDSINIALKSIIPKLSIELAVCNAEVKQDGNNYVQVEVYSNRNGKRFLTKYESEGIKRIISLLQYLIALYNSPEVCLVVDELDSGIFEYLLGEMLGMFNEEAKGQLIFTSHNLRILEKLPNKNIVCSTINPYNRYIRLVGVEKNHNRRDFYIRTITLGGQKEELYDETELQSMGYAFRRAGRGESKVEIEMSNAFRKLLKSKEL